MNLEILIKAAQIANQLDKIDPKEFVLKNPLKIDSDLLKLVVNQAIFNQTLAQKIPEWQDKNLLAPAKISLEQCSSQITAEYKSQKVNGRLGIDLTGGLGVDSYFFAKKFQSFVHNEINQELSKIVEYNYQQLNIKNVKHSNSKAEELNFSEHVDFFYLDPARRDAANRKMVSLKDCQPNLIEIKDKLLQNAKMVMVKYSPMLDIKDTIALLQHVKEVIILSEKNEVKELVFTLTNELCEDPTISCVNLGSSQSEFSFKYTHENIIHLQFKEPRAYLYEPNASIMKAGGFKSIAANFEIDKIAANSHLYSSETLKNDFPGRIFKIENVINFDKKLLNKVIETKKANVSTRNFPFSPDEIKKQLGLKDGGDKYLFFTENHNKKKIVLICSKIQNTLK
ncbi:THUMP-like domain-containing protein [Lacihabitans soyangensis]|uniref:SAM-dependent methyltransferase n=1 Tax=Lacihabitans soyangensis TaxID=869394 RepID=A0AAE3GYS1_9BACT|nr:SAM-dependent methyltransferase [Lacihabitans soyangensis]MCP9761532.1 SAM-dependent methyltransferase [Lacihabitans soyangensis]